MPVEWTYTTPVFPSRFALMPTISDRAARVSPGKTGAVKRHAAYPRLATALSETSGTVFPNTVWKTSRGSKGMRSIPIEAAKVSPEVNAKRDP